MSNDIITKIEEFDTGPETRGWGGEAGYRIHTNDQVVTLAIGSEQNCCEDWGYLMSEDDVQRFVGSTLLDVEITDTACFNHGLALGSDEDSFYEGEAMFVNVHTSMGLLQFVAYNIHNGYYGHQARVESKQVKHEVVL